MSESSMDFVKQFHNLPGDNIQEKYRSLFQLFHQHQPSPKHNQAELDSITANLKPLNYLEKQFRIDFLIYFRRSQELYNEFQKGDEIALRKLQQHDWFFQEQFTERGAQEFVDVLPTMSYNAKVKILKNVRPSEAKSDEIFEALHERYGIFYATFLLPKCSVKKINEILTSQTIQLTFQQLKMVYNKDPHLIEIYLEERIKHKGDAKFMNDHPFFAYLAQKNPEMFAKLLNQYQFEVHLGRRTTKKFIQSQKSNVLANPKCYLTVLKPYLVIQKLGHELKRLLFERHPKKSELYWKSLLKYYPKKQRFNVFKSVYNSTYRLKFGENIDAITEEIFEIITDPLEREKLAKLKLDKEENEIYLKYVTPAYCLNEFKAQLNQMTSSERIKYINIVTRCCLLNYDLDSLLKICNLVAVRFRNDDKKVRYEFFTAFGYNNSIFNELTEHHWTFIMEIIAMIKLKSEWVFNEHSIRFKYLEYLIKNNRPIKDVILQFTDWLDQMSSESLVWKDLKIYKKVLCELIEIGPYKLEELDGARYDCYLAYQCHDYNKRNPKDTVNIHENPRILQSVKYTLQNETSTYIHSVYAIGIQYIVCTKESSKELKNLYFKAFNKFGSLSGCLWFLKNEPKLLQENLDVFLVNIFEIWDWDHTILWNFIKKYNHLELDTKIVEFCKVKLMEDFKEKKKLVEALSILATPESHVDFVKTNLTEDDFTQCEFIQNLHLINAPTVVLPLLLEFCRGDFVGICLGPIYSSICKLPEDQTKIFIEKLEQDEDVFVSRHAMRLSCIVYDAVSVYDCFKNATVSSLMVFLKYFVKNPSETLWSLIEEKLCHVEQKHLKILKGAIKVDIPSHYKSRYFEKVWEISNKYNNNGIRKLLIQKSNKNVIEKFHPQFAYKIIDDSIFRIEEANDFIAALFIHVNDKDKFRFILKKFTEFKENCWNFDRDARRKLYKLIQSIFKTYNALEKSDDKFANEFLNAFKFVFDSWEAFEETVMISLMQLKNESNEKSAEILLELSNELSKVYGKFTVSLLINIVNEQVFPQILSNDRDKIQLCLWMLAVKKSVDVYLLLIGILPKSEPEDIIHFELYSDILNELKKVTDPSVQLQFNLYLKSEAPPPPKDSTYKGCCVMRC